MEPDFQSPPVAIVGAGAVGTALARALADSEYRVEAIVSRTAESARRLAAQVTASVASSQYDALPDDVRFIFLCVPDDALVEVAEELAEVEHPWNQTVVAHTSGVRTAGALAPLSERGAAVLSFHPMQTFAGKTPTSVFNGSVIGLEGDDSAVAAGETVTRALGAQPLVLTEGEKTRYHCAAALASNGLVALMGVVEEVFGDAASDASFEPTDVVAPLVEQTWKNVEERGSEDALTGPVARGDDETIQAHLDVLASAAPHLVPVYVALSTEMVRLAVRGGQLDPDRAQSLLKMLGVAAQTSANDGPREAPH